MALDRTLSQYIFLIYFPAFSIVTHHFKVNTLPSVPSPKKKTILLSPSNVSICLIAQHYRAEKNRKTERKGNKGRVKTFYFIQNIDRENNLVDWYSPWDSTSVFTGLSYARLSRSTCKCDFEPVTPFPVWVLLRNIVKEHVLMYFRLLNALTGSPFLNGQCIVGKQADAYCLPSASLGIKRIKGRCRQDQGVGTQLGSEGPSYSLLGTHKASLSRAISVFVWDNLRSCGVSWNVDGQIYTHLKERKKKKITQGEKACYLFHQCPSMATVWNSLRFQDDLTDCKFGEIKIPLYGEIKVLQAWFGKTDHFYSCFIGSYRTLRTINDLCWCGSNLSLNSPHVFSITEIEARNPSGSQTLLMTAPWLLTGPFIRLL